jgi:hypothetical protein
MDLTILGAARRELGLRYTIRLVPPDPAPVRRSHGRLPEDPRDGPVRLCSDPSAETTRPEATEAEHRLLRLALADQPALDATVEGRTT